MLGADTIRLCLDSPDDADGLAERLRALQALGDAERRTMGAALRAQVIAAQSLEGLIERLQRILLTGEMVEPNI